MLFRSGSGIAHDLGTPETAPSAEASSTRSQSEKSDIYKTVTPPGPARSEVALQTTPEKLSVSKSLSSIKNTIFGGFRLAWGASQFGTTISGLAVTFAALSPLVAGMEVKEMIDALTGQKHPILAAAVLSPQSLKTHPR